MLYAIDCFKRKIPLIHKDLGFDLAEHAFVSVFELDGVKIRSVFSPTQSKNTNEDRLSQALDDLRKVNQFIVSFHHD